MISIGGFFMNCRCCQKPIKYKVSWAYLFHNPIYLLCDTCYNAFNPILKRKNIILNNITIEWYYFVSAKTKAKAEYFLKEISHVFFHLIEKKKSVLYFDFFPNLAMLETLDAFRENVAIITCFGD